MCTFPNDLIYMEFKIIFFVNIDSQKFYLVILLNSYTSECQYYITVPCSHKLKFGGLCHHVIIREQVDGVLKKV